MLLEYQSQTQFTVNNYQNLTHMTGEQAEQSSGSADANTSSINNAQQNRSSTLHQETLKMDM